MDDVIGIDEEGLKKTADKLYDYCNEIKAIFSEYNEIINSTNAYFQGEVAEKYRKKYLDFSKNMDLVSKSFLDYRHDLLNTIKRYNNDFFIDDSKNS